MGQLIDLTARRFGRWTVLRLASRGDWTPGRQRHARWLCRCECGVERAVSGAGLRSGVSRRCGPDCGSPGRGDLAGSAFHRLTAVRRAGRAKGAAAEWECRCECGRLHVVRASYLVSGQVKSCGCLKSGPTCASGRRTHAASRPGGRHHPTYRCWLSMRSRCSNPNSTSFRLYGGRGIRVCPRWDSFEAFLADVGERPSPKHSLDRIDPNGDYTPGNVRWADRKTQNRNTRRNKFLAAGGVTRTVSAWAEATGLTVSALAARLDRGWTAERAVNTPQRRKRDPRKTLLDSTRAIWHGMRRRCANPADRSFPRYGGRGITVCQRWRESFEAFAEDMGRRPSWRHSIDRIDVDGDYEPGNCRWATAAVQARNRRPS